MHRNMSQQRDISDRRRPLTDYRAELKSPYCRPTANQYDQDKRMRREIANSNERRRMQSINNGFTVLRKKLPSQHQEEKLSKANILQQTSEYITKLEDEVRVLSNQLKQYAFRHPDTSASRKRKNLDRNGSLREDEYLNSLQDEKLQLQCRLEEEMDRTRELSRRIAELEKAAAAYKSMPITPGVEVRAVSASKPPPTKLQPSAKPLPPHRIAVPSLPTPPAAAPATPAVSVAQPTPSSESTVVASSTPTVVRVRDSPEPPAKRQAPYHGLHQLILAADHVEKERHGAAQVRAVSRTGAQLMVKAEGQEGSAGGAKNLQHLQLVQLVSAANSSSGGGSGAESGTATIVSSGTNVGGAANVTTTTATGASTSQLIQIVPAGQDISPSAHVLHLVTTRTGKVGAVHEHKHGAGGGSAGHQAQQQQAQQQGQQEQREQAPGATTQQVLRLVPQVRLQSGAGGSVKVEAGALDQLTSKLNVTADMAPQLTLVMRRSTSAASSAQPAATSIPISVSTATSNSETMAAAPASQSVSSQVLEPPTS